MSRVLWCNPLSKRLDAQQGKRFNLGSWSCKREVLAVNYNLTYEPYFRIELFGLHTVCPWHVIIRSSI